MSNYTPNRAGIRRFVTDNRGCTVLELATGIGMVYKACYHSVTRMIQSGMLIGQRDKGMLTLAIGRDLIPFRYTTSEESKAVTIQKQLDRNEAAKQARREATDQKRIAHELVLMNKPPTKFNIKKPVMGDQTHHCTESFIAAGGDHEILPSVWQQPMRYPSVGLSYQPRSGRSTSA